MADERWLDVMRQLLRPKATGVEGKKGAWQKMGQLVYA